MKRTVSIILAVVMMLALAVTAYAVTASGDTIVFRTASGKKYHTENCASLNGNGIEITLAEAVEKKLEPCTKCNPPTLAETSEEQASSDAGAAGAAVAATAGTAAAAKKGFSPILAFIIGVVVGAVGITFVRGKLLEMAEANAEETEEEVTAEEEAEDEE